MRIVFRYLRPLWAVMALCLALLFGQAMCDLALPDRMSNIVNIGIQQGGVEASAPEVIPAQAGALLTQLMTDGQRADFDAAYTLRGPDPGASRQAVYPALKIESAYILRSDVDQAALDAAGDAYSSAALAFVSVMQVAAQNAPEGASQGGAQGETASLQEGLGDVTPEQLRALYAQFTPLIEQMAAAGQLAPLVQGAADADGMLKSQVGVQFTRLFYQALGRDMAKLQRDYIMGAGGWMLLLVLAGSLASVLVGLFSARIAASVSRRMRRDVFARVQDFASAEFDRFSTASLITRTTNDVQQVQMLLTMGIRILCYAPIMGVGGVIMALRRSPSLSWIIAAAVAVLLGIIAVLLALALPKFRSLQKLVDRLNLVSRENLSGMPVIRAFGNEKREEARFARANDDLTRTNRFVQRTMAMMFPIMMLLMNGVSLLIMWFAAHAIDQSSMQLGDMMAFIQYTMQIIMSFLMIAMMFVMLPRAAVSATRIGEVLDTPPAIRDPAQPARLPGAVRGEVTFRDVSFRYPHAERDALSHISFTARPGETTAFIGSTGSGKSTVVNLLPRFYDVTEGTVLLDGVDVRTLPQQTLRAQIGYVPQQGVLFSGDVASNVRFGAPEADEAAVNRALEIAQAADFVAALEEGLAHPIAQGGDNVSGGQKQRLAIARALAKQPPVYIFDDAFSALDFKTDQALRAALKRSTAGATVLLVAQRISTIMQAEQIVVLDEGAVVGIGTHEELMASCDTYREIAETQLATVQG